MSKKVILVTLCYALVVAPCLAAGEKAKGRGNGCDPAGTWWGQNETFQLEYLVTIIPMGAGRYSIVAEGLNEFPPYEEFTGFRGEIKKNGRRTFQWQQILFAKIPGSEVPDILGVRGKMVLVDCDHLGVSFSFANVYLWGQTPFVDDPVMDLGPSMATYTRVPNEPVSATSTF